MKTVPSTFVALLITTACSTGSVTLPDGYDAFGPVKSACWMVVTSDDDAERHEEHFLVASSDAGYCRESQKAYDELETLFGDYLNDESQRYEELYEQYGYDKGFFAALNRESCRAQQELFRGYAEATSHLIGDDTSVLTLFPYPKTGDELVEGVYRAEGGDGTFAGVLAQYDGNPYQDIADSLGEVDCDALGPYDYWSKGIDFSFLDDLGFVEGGELVLQADGDDAFDVELTDGTLNGEAGFELSARFERCEITLDSGLDVNLSF